MFDEEGLLITGESFCETKFLSNNTKIVYKYREPGWDKLSAWLYYILGFLDFQSSYKIFYVDHLKQSSF